jgi:murein DD-endopeptidase MepM/ murein hydrolase activator NlpD
MSRSLWISGSLACLVIGAGFLFAQNEPAKTVAAPAPAPKPDSRARVTVPVDWPTPYPYFKNNAGPNDFLQATASGKVESGGYGMVREGGAKFHEGVDIRPVAPRDRKGEPTDIVTAAMPGRVAYINTRTNGAYGRYIVLEHRTGGLTLYTLYAHLASTNPALREGASIPAETKLGVMGRSDGNGGFPKDRAHLHFEVGLRLSDNFARWYAGRRYPDPNQHANFNGINLAGLDPTEFFAFARANDKAPEEGAFVRWIQSRPVAVAVETPAHGTPDILRRNPALIVGGAPTRTPAGWRIGFTAEGVPVRWEPLTQNPGATRVVLVDNAQSREARRRGLIVTAKGKNNYGAGSTLETALELTVQN